MSSAGSVAGDERLRLFLGLQLPNRRNGARLAARLYEELAALGVYEPEQRP